MSLNIRNAFFFDAMLTPKIITLIYWILLLVIIRYGLEYIFDGGFTFGKFFGGLLLIILGAVFARIWCELLIVLFKINDNIRRLAEK